MASWSALDQQHCTGLHSTPQILYFLLVLKAQDSAQFYVLPFCHTSWAPANPATPPTHIWERCPKKTGTYIYENVYWAIISRSGQDQKQLRLGAPPTPVGKNCNFYPIYFDGSQKNIRFLYIKCHLNIYLFRCHTFTSNAVCSYCKGTHCIECTGVTR